MVDVIVVGAGGAGCEASIRLARAGLDVLLVTTSLDTVFSAGRESVALPMPEGTLGGELIEHLAVGDDGTAAAWDVHAQAKYLLEREDRIHVMQSNVDALLLRADRQVQGIETWEGLTYSCSVVALCVGPFLHARLESGATREYAGRPGEMAYDELADDLVANGFRFTPEHHGGGGGDTPAWQGEFLRFADGSVIENRVADAKGLYAAGQVTLGVVGYDAVVRDAASMVDTILGDLGVHR